VKSSVQHERLETDFIVIGGGVAGLRAAVDLAKAGRVLLLTKTSLTESNSQYAQGGIAAAVGESDSTVIHFSDTVAAGAGLCDEAAVKILADEGPEEIRNLIEWGTEFDVLNGHVALAREGAHSQARVLHAHGDATGREIIRSLSVRVRSLPSVTVMAFAFVQELIVVDGRVAGVGPKESDELWRADRERRRLLATRPALEIDRHSPVGYATRPRQVSLSIRAKAGGASR